jgi:hypothetical protein
MNHVVARVLAVGCLLYPSGISSTLNFWPSAFFLVVDRPII